MTKIWLGVIAVTIANAVIKASGPLALGRRRLPPVAVKITTLLAPVLLAALVVTDLGGPGWRSLDATQVAGVAVAAAGGLARIPMLVALACGIVVTAGLRLWLGS